MIPVAAALAVTLVLPMHPVLEEVPVYSGGSTAHAKFRPHVPPPVFHVKPKPAPKTAPSHPDPSPVPPRPVSGRGWAAGDWGRFPAWVEQTALCIAHHESWTSGLWTAVNQQGSSASGAFQFIDGSWRAYSRSAGLSGYSRAVYAPPRVQAAVLAHVVTEYGTYPWEGSGC